MADVVRNLDIEELIDYLQRRDLKLDNDDFKILRNEKISGLAFLETTKAEFRSYGMKGGPATVLVKFIDEISEQKLRGFSTYKTLEELKDVLRKYKVNGEDITSIKQFNPGMCFFILFFLDIFPSGPEEKFLGKSDRHEELFTHT